MAAPSGLRERKKQQTRERIVSVARERFVRQGYEATTTAEIAELADVSPSTLFNYFPTKSDVFFADYDELIREFISYIVSRSPGETAIEATVRWHTNQRAAPVEPDVRLWRRELRLMIDASPMLQALERERYAEAQTALVHGVAADLGDSPTDLRPELIAAMKVALMLTAARFQSHDLSEDAEFEAVGDYVDACLRAAADAIAAVPPPKLSSG
jgi:AcrR family transcriptional regulator